MTTRKALIPGAARKASLVCRSTGWPARKASCSGTGPPNRLPRPAATIRAVQMDIELLDNTGFQGAHFGGLAPGRGTRYSSAHNLCSAQVAYKLIKRNDPDPSLSC